MLQILYGLAAFLETGIGIWAFAQAVPKRRKMKKRHIFSEIILITFIFSGVYGFPTSFWKFENEDAYAKIILILYCAVLFVLTLLKVIKKQVGRIESDVIIAILFWGMVIWTSCQYWAGYLSETAIILGNALPVLYLFAFYQCTLLQAYLWEFLYLTNMGLLKGSYIVCIGILQDKHFEYFFKTPRIHTFSEIIYLLIIYVILLILFKYISVEHFMQKILYKYKKILLMVAIIEFIVLDILMDGGAGKINDKNFTGTLIIVVAIVFILLILYIKSLNKMTDTEKRLLDVRNEAIENQYMELNESYERYRCLVHDEKHMVLYLKECLEEGDIQEAVKFLKNYQDSIIDQGKRSWTGISTLDFMLNIKKRKMDKLQIIFCLDAGIEDIPMEDADFIVVLGNLLDNAIEAAAKCELNQRRIDLSIKNINEMFVLKIKNSSISKPNIKNNRFITNKEEKNKHGWGIESVKHIVDKYNGSITFQYDTDIFEVAIIITNEL